MEGEENGIEYFEKTIKYIHRLEKENKNLKNELKRFMNPDELESLDLTKSQLAKENARLKAELLKSKQGELMKIVVYDLWNKKILKYNSLDQAAKATGLSDSRILCCLKTGQKWGGRKFVLETEK